LRRLLIDIETSPNVAHVWGLRNQDIGLPMLRVPKQVICVGAKWYREDAFQFYSIHDTTPRVMLQRARALLNEADAVVHYNGQRFDVPHLNTEFLLQGFEPPSPFQQIDLYRAVSRRFAFPSNKLAYVAEALGIGAKVQHSGHELWVRCMADDPEAWAEMRAYNEQDVRLLEPLHDVLLPWIPGYPSNGAMTGTDSCPCGSTDLRREGYAYTRVGRYQRYVCRACGRWLRSSRRIDGTRIVEVAA
jgi:uncharacterized protein